jgi:lactate dehydrogenase-like 2-hydroxyacid dehydrogenase
VTLVEIRIRPIAQIIELLTESGAGNADCATRGPTHRILVSNVVDWGFEALGEHAWALLLAVAKRLEEGRPTLQQGRWRPALVYPVLGLHSRTLGLFGPGKIGGCIAEIGRAFGMRVITTTRSPQSTPFEQLVAESDFLVIASPTRIIHGRAIKSSSLDRIMSFSGLYAGVYCGRARAKMEILA